MKPQDLKNSILQLAIQGKLVEQRPEEGTAEDLYRQIQGEKQRRIKAGTNKKEKTLQDISEDEKAFEIPESWKWMRVSELGEVIGGGTPKTENPDNWNNAEIPWLTPADMKFINGKYAERGERNISVFGLKNSSARLMPKGTILYSSRAPIGYIAIAANDISTNQGFKSLVPTVMGINEYMYYCLMAVTSDIVSRASGTTFKEISGTDFGLTVVPIPPLPEQKRIVAKIEELLPYIDRYEKAWSKLEDFNKRFQTDMQKSILQMAIQGKLVEQCPEEGTGEELYQLIQAEKQRLIKAGAIKKDKPLPEISEDEKPFDIPENWKWVRLASVASLCLGKMLDRQKNTGTAMPYLRNVNVRWNDFNLDDMLEMKFEDINSDRFQIRKGDLVICEGGEPGRCAVWQSETPIHFQKALHRIRFHGSIEASLYQFVFHYFKVSGLLNSLFTGTTIKHLTGQTLEKIIIPLPPLSEQKRIVARLEVIFSLCEKLN